MLQMSYGQTYQLCMAIDDGIDEEEDRKACIALDAKVKEAERERAQWLKDDGDTAAPSTLSETIPAPSPNACGEMRRSSEHMDSSGAGPHPMLVATCSTRTNCELPFLSRRRASTWVA
jgi:hypothetical protein